MIVKGKVVGALLALLGGSHAEIDISAEELAYQLSEQENIELLKAICKKEKGVLALVDTKKERSCEKPKPTPEISDSQNGMYCKKCHKPILEPKECKHDWVRAIIPNSRFVVCSKCGMYGNEPKKIEKLDWAGKVIEVNNIKNVWWIRELADKINELTEAVNKLNGLSPERK